MVCCSGVIAGERQSRFEMRESLVPDWWSSYGAQEMAAGHSDDQNATWVCNLRDLYASNFSDSKGSEFYFSFNVVSRDLGSHGLNPSCGSVRVTCDQIFDFCEQHGGEFNSMRIYLCDMAEELINKALS